MKTEFALFIIGLVILALIFCPIALIWAITTLFPITIPLTLKTWFAALILLASLGGIKASVQNKK